MLLWFSGGFGKNGIWCHGCQSINFISCNFSSTWNKLTSTWGLCLCNECVELVLKCQIDNSAVQLWQSSVDHRNVSLVNWKSKCIIFWSIYVLYLGSSSTRAIWENHSLVWQWCFLKTSLQSVLKEAQLKSLFPCQVC